MKSKTILTLLVIFLLFPFYSTRIKVKTAPSTQLLYSNFLLLLLSNLELNNKVFGSELSPLNNSNQKQIKKHSSNNIKNKITVYTRSNKGHINRKIFGNNLSGYILPAKRSATRREWFGHSNYGTGIWNPKFKKPEKEVVELARNAGISVVRFPGGGYSDYYNWKNAVGKRTDKYLFGIDEFLETCKQIDAEVIFTVNYLTGNEMDAADLIEYLNYPDNGSNPNGGIDWAKVRSENGHPEPYNVKYFEIGNEVHDRVSSTSYAHGYLKFYNKMKEVDPTIKIGPVLHFLNYWNISTMDIIKNKIDFGSLHTYSKPSGGYSHLLEKDSARITAKEIFEKTLCLPEIRFEWELQTALKTMEAEAKKSIPLAITEYNGGFAQEKPVPYRHTLGNALVNAEFLHVFIKPENNLLMANYWGYLGFFGMIKSNVDFIERSFKTPLFYFKRPNYYVYQLYHNNFGDILLNHELKSDTYDISHYDSFVETIVSLLLVGKGTNQNLLGNNWEISKVTGVNALQKNDILEINFKNPEKFNYLHSKKSVKVLPNTYYKLSGYIKTVNLVDKKGIYLAVHAKDLHGKHTQPIKGTTDWIYCETVFKTLSYTWRVNVVARRLGEKGPLRGKVFFKNIKLEKFIPSINTDIPYLSVNTSKSSDNKTIYLMIINKNLEHDIKTEIILNNFTPSGSAHINTLWGNNVSSTNERYPYNNVRIHTNEIMPRGNILTISLKKHSLTSIEIKGECK